MKFKQKNKKSGQSKMRRLVGNPNHGTIGFCNFELVKDFSSYVSDEEIEQNPYSVDYYEHNNMYDWAIVGKSNYHSDFTIEQMYKTNGKKW